MRAGTVVGVERGGASVVKLHKTECGVLVLFGKPFHNYDCGVSLTFHELKVAQVHEISIYFVLLVASAIMFECARIYPHIYTRGAKLHLLFTPRTTVVTRVPW